MSSTSRLYLVRHPATAATRQGAFPIDEPLDARGSEDALRLSTTLRGARAAFTSPALRARQTAEAAGLGAEIDGCLSECDFGLWLGLTLQQVHERDPEGLRAWFEDPEAAPHGGESLAEMVARVERFLDRCKALDGTTVAITHGGPIKAAVALALGAPIESFWRIEVSPASVTELCRRDGGWSVMRLNWGRFRCPSRPG
jgi:broad specificity phosphatase PhoE